MKAIHHTDEELLILVSQDNEEAFRLLYDRYWNRLFWKAADKLKSQADAEEVVQDVFINLWKRRSRLKLLYTFNTYISAALRYEILSKLAKRKTSILSYLDDPETIVLPDNSTQQWLAFDDMSKQVEAAVQKLPEKCQKVFRLSREQGLSEKQISQELQISTKTVEAHITKALKTLRLALNQLLMYLIVFFSLIFS